MYIMRYRAMQKRLMITLFYMDWYYIVSCSMKCSFPLIGRGSLVLLIYSLFTIMTKCASRGPSTDLPNIVIFYADDLGYGDLDVYGHPTSSTPNIRRLALGGKVLTQFYSAAAVCSPSRAALLTGRYQMRSGVYPKVFNVTMSGGLPFNEITIAELLKPLGYRTSAVGKWHLGLGKDAMYLPPSHGFDEFLGLPASQGQCPCNVCFYPDGTCHQAPCKAFCASCALFNGTTIVEQPVDLLTLDNKYIEHSRTFIRSSVTSGIPFFLYYASQHTHHPQYAGKETADTSMRGHFGDSLSALDWEVGQIYEELQKQGILESTLFIFSSDNGPSLNLKQWGGNAGLFKCGKGTTYEGGVRVPAIVHWPGHITPGMSMELSSTLDVLPTLAAVTGAKLPDVILDGYDMSPFLFKGLPGLREVFLYYPPAVDTKRKSFAIRYKQYKAVFYTIGSSLSYYKHGDNDCDNTGVISHDPPLLFDLDKDPSERFKLSVKNALNKDIIFSVTKMRADFDAEMDFAESETRKPQNENLMPCCNRGCKPYPFCCHCTSEAPPSNYSINMDVHKNPWKGIV